VAAAELSHADRRTDRHEEANIRFLKFCEKGLKRCLVMATGRTPVCVYSVTIRQASVQHSTLLCPPTGRTHFPMYSRFKLKITGFNLYKMQSFYG